MPKAKSNHFHPMSQRIADLWHRLDLEARAELIVSDERRAWILERYPPEEMGRPGLFAPPASLVRKTDKIPNDESEELAEIAAD